MYPHASTASSQASTEHARPSLQLIGVPATQPRLALHDSTPSQYAPLSHTAATGMCTHAPSAPLHESVVHAKASAQLGGTPAWHPSVALHVSAPSQKTPSLQTVSFGVWVHPATASEHASAVHARPSPHASGGAA